VHGRGKAAGTTTYDNDIVLAIGQVDRSAVRFYYELTVETIYGFGNVTINNSEHVYNKRRGGSMEIS